MTNFNAKTYVDSLVKIANDMVDMTNEQATEKASPEEVLQGLEGVISALEQIASSIPAEQTPTEEPQPEQSQGPLQAKLNESNQKIAELTKIVESQQREKLADEYSELFDSSLKTAKYDEVLKSEKTIDQITTELNAIKTFADTVGNSKTASSFQPYTKVAKSNSERLYIL